MKTLSLKIPEALDRLIVHEVSRRRIAKSALVREAIERYLAQPAPRRRRGAESFLDLAGDLLGKRSGPGDLSANPEYLRGFGK